MSELRFAAAGLLGSSLVGGLFATTRIVRTNTDYFERYRRSGRPVMFVFWHGQLLPLVRVHQKEGIVVLVSEHADGEYIARILERRGFGTARGSSTRGATRGLRALVRAARSGRDIAVTPDGPRGPAREVKVGALSIAGLAGVPVVPIVVAASRARRLRSWDSFLVPRPFSRLLVDYLPPVHVPRDADRSELERMGLDLGAALYAGTARLEALAGSAS